MVNDVSVLHHLDGMRLQAGTDELSYSGEVQDGELRLSNWWP